MDASVFYWLTRLQDHSRSRLKATTSSAEQLLLKIADGNASDGDFSDDELGETAEVTTLSQPEESEKTATGTFGEDSEHEEPLLPQPPNQNEKKKVEVKWISKDFTPTNTDCTFSQQPTTSLLEPLQYFLKYFTQDIFSELAKFTNIYALQQDGIELQTTVDEIK
ncbi:hypothetical protein V5799_010801, partial [Amblyomma americanum]